MSSSIVTLCEAFAAALNNAPEDTFSQSFTAAFEYAPDYTILDADTLRVIVTDAGGEISNEVRAFLIYRDQVKVVVLWRVKQSTSGIDTSRMDEALILLDEIIEYMARRDLASTFTQDGGIQRGTGEKDKQHYFPGNLEERVFAASITVPYRRKKSLRG